MIQTQGRSVKDSSRRLRRWMCGFGSRTCVCGPEKRAVSLSPRPASWSRQFRGRMVARNNKLDRADGGARACGPDVAAEATLTLAATAQQPRSALPKSDSCPRLCPGLRCRGPAGTRRRAAEPRRPGSAQLGQGEFTPRWRKWKKGWWRLARARVSVATGFSRVPNAPYDVSSRPRTLRAPASAAVALVGVVESEWRDLRLPDPTQILGRGPLPRSRPFHPGPRPPHGFTAAEPASPLSPSPIFYGPIRKSTVLE